MSGGGRTGIRGVSGATARGGRGAGRAVRAGMLGLCVLALAACEGAVRPDQDPYTYDSENQHNQYLQEGSMSGEGGLFDIFGTGRKQPGGSSIGVNAYLWRATLNTISFMPLTSADSAGGVIITDWYAPPETPGERFKMNVYILGRELRADGVRVAVFRQRLNGNGTWADSPVTPETATNLENKILTQARQLRSSAVADAN